MLSVYFGISLMTALILFAICLLSLWCFFVVSSGLQFEGAHIWCPWWKAEGVCGEGGLLRWGGPEVIHKGPCCSSHLPTVSGCLWLPFGLHGTVSTADTGCVLCSGFP